MALHRRITARNCLLAVALVLLFTLILNPSTAPRWERGQYVGSHDDPELKADAAEEPINGKQGSTRRTALVVASQASEDATWLTTYFPKWEKNIYRVDDPNAKLTVPKNKGRESMVYLT
jgi:hypothetical protein